MNIIGTLISLVVVFLPAVIAAALFAFALVRFLRVKQPEERKKRRGLLIVSSVILGIIAAAYAGIMILLSLAIRNM